MEERSSGVIFSWAGPGQPVTYQTTVVYTTVDGRHLGDFLHYLGNRGEIPVTLAALKPQLFIHLLSNRRYDLPIGQRLARRVNYRL